jgi:hypothetical protein
MRGELFSSSPFPLWARRLLALLLAVLPTLMVEAAAQAQTEVASPQFPPGILTTIAPDLNSRDTVSVHDMVELRANEQLRREPLTDSSSRTLYEKSKSVHFRRDVWCLELSFKQLRMIEVDIPQPSGKMQRKLVWYMVYRVRNSGAGLTPEQQADGTFTAVEKPSDEITFAPQFILASQDLDREGKPIRKAYLDRILPAAVQAIRQRELSDGRLLNSAEMSEQVFPAENGRAIQGHWGVAIWEDVDPQIDFFSVYVNGLTNAYDWQDAPEGVQVGDPPGKGRQLIRKQLQLNFWRPGDAYVEDEREIRFGPAPGKGDLYGVGEGVAFRWIYR